MTDRRYHMEAEELAAAEATGPDRVPPNPRDAAGVVLARDTAAGPEVLLVRRRPDVAFAAGAHVFPGGTLDEEDSDDAWGDRLVAPPPEATAGASSPGGPPERAFVIAALREMFEETGVLLVSDPVPSAEAIAAERAALVAGLRSFQNVVERLNVRLAGDRLVLCARWITPESLSRRYDARFFLAQAPPEVQVTAEQGELVEHVWIAPAEALRRYFDHDLRMMFPTARTLGWLEDGGSVAEWSDRFRAARTLPILPRLRRVGGGIIPVIPGEPRYDEREGDG